MALIQCKECGKEISEQAKSCPHCGCPLIEDKNSASKEKFEDFLKKVKEKTSTLTKKQISIIATVVLVFGLVLCIPSGAEKDKAFLEKNLLNPKSLVIYEAYTNSNYSDGGRATLIYFGAQNKGGGVSDDWALVYDGNIWFESNYEQAKRKGDNKGILEHADLIEAQFSVAIGDADWKKVNLK